MHAYTDECIVYFAKTLKLRQLLDTSYSCRVLIFLGGYSTISMHCISLVFIMMHE